jgi:hypothetical protein
MNRKELRPVFIIIVFTVIVFCFNTEKNAWAYGLSEGANDTVSLGAAYSFHSW